METNKYDVSFPKMRSAIVVGVMVFLLGSMTIQSVSGRYLPTRNSDDKLDRLRELLKDLLESQNLNNNRQQASDLGYDGGIEIGGNGIGGPSGGLLSGSSGRTILFKRDIQEQVNSGSPQFQLHSSHPQLSTHQK